MARAVDVAKQATFETDDKRGQYARLVVFNHGVKEKLISKDKDVNSVSNGDLQKAFKSLVGGNLLEGKGGIEVIQNLSKNGSTTGNPLTVAYAQEVRPFIRRGTLSGSFGRRGRKAGEPRAAASKTSGTGKKSGAARKSGGRKTAASRGRKSGTARAPKVPATPAAEALGTDAPPVGADDTE